MDFKNFLFNNPQKTLTAIIILFWVAICSLLYALWTRYSTHNIDMAQSQSLVINNYLLTINPENHTALDKATAIILQSEDTTIEEIFFTIYSESGEILYSNASYNRNKNILSYNNLDEKIVGSQASISSSTSRYDEILQKDCVITSTYSSALDRYIISECPINNDISLIGFIKKFPKKLTMIMILIIVVNLCMLILSKHMSNIAKLRRYIMQLSQEDDIVANDSTQLTLENSVKGIANDLTMLYRTRIEILKRNDLEREKAIIDEKNRLYSKRTLANNLNHEIKTPIGIIIGYLDTLLNHPDIDKETQTNFLKKCLINTQRLQNMVVNIAMISRIEDGNSNIALEDININKIACLAKEDLKFTLEEYNMNFQIEVEEDIFVKGNEMLLYNTICNLVKNSCFYSGGTDIIFKKKTQDDKFYIFSLSDNGKGVPEESIAKLFNRFYRIDKDKNKKSGTGLGLPIVKESISLCGGCISAANKENGGLEFTFSLPIAKK